MINYLKLERTASSFLGLERNTTSHGEKWISALGAFLGILAVYSVSQWYLPRPESSLVVASMGASAVLLFAVPHGALSQPWAVIGGHLISAAIGVTCNQYFPDQIWVPAAAVGLAVGAMYYLRCIHPPGGATALAAVVGGPELSQLGYEFLLFPVAINLASILLLAVVFNGFFAWRRYPAVLTRREPVARQSVAPRQGIELSHEDLAVAMEGLNSYIDVTAEDLAQLLELALENAERNSSHPAEVASGRCYSNGLLGRRWSIRQVIDASTTSRPGGDQVIYKTLAGDGAYDTGICRRDEFQRWARFEVREQKGRWLKIQDSHPEHQLADDQTEASEGISG